MTTSPTSPTPCTKCEPFGFSAKYYDVIHAAKDYKREAHAVASHLKLGRSSRIIEFGSGTGEFLRNFHEENRVLVGVEPSGPMLMIAEQKFQQLGIKPRFYLNDIMDCHESLGSRSPFDAGFCMFGVMSYATVSDSLRDVLKCVRRRLASGGSRFVFDFVNYACCVAHLRKHSTTHHTTPDGMLYRRIEKSFDITSGILTNTITMEVNGTTCVEEHLMRAATPDAVRQAAMDAGFKVIGTYPGFDSPVSDDHGSAFIQSSDFYFVTVLEA